MLIILKKSLWIAKTKPQKITNKKLVKNN